MPFPPPTVPRHTRLGLHHDPILANPISAPVSLAHLTQALPHYAAEDVVRIHECTLHPTPGHHDPFNTSSRPSHCNVIVTTDRVSSDSLLVLAPQISGFISGINPSLMAESSHLGYGGLTVSTTQVPTSPCSFCQLINAPFISPSGNCMTLADTKRFLLNSAHKDNIRLAASPRFVCDSRTTNACTIYFDIWDSQKGPWMRTFVNQSINIGRSVCFFQWASPKIGVPFCSHCSSWGHNLDYC